MPTGVLQTGFEGEVTLTATQEFAAVVINVTHWTLTVESEFFERDTFDSAAPVHGTQKYRGMYVVRGTIDGFLDSAAVPLLAWFEPTTYSGGTKLNTTANVRLQQHHDGVAGRFWEFEAHMTNWRPSTKRMGSLNSYSIDFVSEGNIVVSDAASIVIA